MSEQLQRVDPLDGEALPEPRRLGEQLAALLAAEIVGGRFPVGSQFPSAEDVGNRFRVSRTVAREAVQTLSMHGLVRLQHGKRTEVLPEEEWNILASLVQEALRRADKADAYLDDLYEFRLLIEPASAARMAHSGSDEAIAQLGALVDRIEQLAEGGKNVQAVLEADREFHNLLARQSGNRVIGAVSRDIREMLGTVWDLSQPSAEEQREVGQQHRRIASAIAMRDPAAAEVAMREHLTWAAELDLRRLRAVELQIQA
jgi:DNA-binding FadR family transcriptional regulator